MPNHDWSVLGVGEDFDTKILYHDNNIYHDIVILFFFKKSLYYIKIFDTIVFIILVTNVEREIIEDK